MKNADENDEEDAARKIHQKHMTKLDLKKSLDGQIIRYLAAPSPPRVKVGVVVVRPRADPSLGPPFPQESMLAGRRLRKRMRKTSFSARPLFARFCTLFLSLLPANIDSHGKRGPRDGSALGLTTTTSTLTLGGEGAAR